MLFIFHGLPLLVLGAEPQVCPDSLLVPELAPAEVTITRVTHT